RRSRVGGRGGQGRPRLLRRSDDEKPLRGASADSPRRVRRNGGAPRADRHPGRRAWGRRDGERVAGFARQGAVRRLEGGRRARVRGGRLMLYLLYERLA